MKRFPFFLLIFLLLGSVIRAQQEIPLRVFRLIYNQQYDSAHVLLEENKSKLDVFYYTVLEIDLSYWENVTGTNSPNYSAFENTLQKYELKNPVNERKKIISLIDLSYQLRYDFKRYHLISALQTRKRTIALYKELKNKANISDRNQTEIFELYNALILYFNQYPSKYFSRSSRDEMQTAIQVMEILSQSDAEMVKTLSAYFLGKIYLQYEKEPQKAVRLFKYLAETYPHNQKFPESLEESRTKSE